MKPPYSRTLFELVDEQAARHPERTAAIHDGRSISYRELAQRSRRVAAALQARNVRRGERIALLINNRIEFLEACFGASALGAVVVPLSTWSRPAELDFLLNDSQAVMLIAVGRFGDQDF